MNVSTVQLARPGFADRVRAACEAAGIHPRLLELEITESAFLEDSQIVRDCLRDLRELGSPLSIDDFGAGHSSLGYLRRFPVHALKIDRQFISEIETGGSAIVAAIVAMSRHLGFRVVAEGVETEAQELYLRQLGCDEMQGFRLARPMPASEVARLLGV